VVIVKCFLFIRSGKKGEYTSTVILMPMLGLMVYRLAPASHSSALKLPVVNDVEGSGKYQQQGCLSVNPQENIVFDFLPSRNIMNELVITGQKQMKRKESNASRRQCLVKGRKT